MNKLTFVLVAMLAMTRIGSAHHQDAKPPPEVAAMMKEMGGPLKCAGIYKLGGQDLKFTSTIKAKSELGGFWIHESIDAEAGKDEPHVLSEAYMMYEPSGKKWHRVEMRDDGVLISSTGDMKDHKLELTGDVVTSEGQLVLKVSIDASNPSKGITIVGQLTFDKKTWSPYIEETCKR